MKSHLVITMICGALGMNSARPAFSATFGQDLEFVRRYASPTVLSVDDGRARIVVVGQFQARVMTSTARGLKGLSHGWINRSVIARDHKEPEGRPYGGEDRFWLAPMGSQFSLFYPPGSEFIDANWRVPPALDWSPFEWVEQGSNHVTFRAFLQITNHPGNRLEAELKRRINLFDRKSLCRNLGITPSESVDMVGFESVNTLVNRGNDWSHETGMLSIWILGKFQGTDQTTVVVPMESHHAHTADLNQYLFDLDSSRLTVAKETVYYRGDGRYRSKIGVLPRSAHQVFGSYNADDKVLTVVRFHPLVRDGDYPNGFTGSQSEPWQGDVIDSYNDGPMDGSIGKTASFYELESCSPVRPLSGGETMTHTHQTYHFEGSRKELDQIAESVLGVGLDSIQSTLR